MGASDQYFLGAPGLLLGLPKSPTPKPPIDVQSCTMKLSGYHVSIVSDGERLEEYSVEISPDEKKATCWISSQSGKEFEVKYRDGKFSTIKGTGKSVHIYTDGYIMCKRPLFPHVSGGKAACVRTSKNTERPFTFADIRTTDQDVSLEDDCVNPDEIGIISIRVFVVENRRKSSAVSIATPDVRNRSPPLIDERTKKAGQHRVSLGGERPCKKRAVICTAVYDPQKPDLVFEFHYRPMAILQALGVVPSPQCEAPLIIDLEDEDTQPPPKRRKTVPKEALLQSMEAELEPLRRRMGELEEEEAGPSGAKKEVVRHDPDDIIDLT